MRAATACSLTWSVTYVPSHSHPSGTRAGAAPLLPLHLSLPPTLNAKFALAVVGA